VCCSTLDCARIQLPPHYLVKISSTPIELQYSDLLTVAAGQGFAYRWQHCGEAAMLHGHFFFLLPFEQSPTYNVEAMNYYLAGNPTAEIRYCSL